MTFQSLDPNGPAAWLVANGHAARWAEREARVRVGDGSGWAYISRFISAAGAFEIANLVAEGWSISIGTTGDCVRVTARKDSK